MSANYGELPRKPRLTRKKKYKLPLPEHGWRGGGERSPDEGPVRPPSKNRPRGKRYSPRSRPN